jgi:hypothetical protein
VRRALERLPDLDRLLVYLRYFQLASFDEIALRTGLSKHAVDTRLWRVRKSLREALREPAHDSPLKRTKSAEELSKARDLYDLFPQEEEQVPPRFVQTLALQSQDSAESAALSQRVTHRVFRRLHLPRCLFAPRLADAGAGPRGIRRLGRAPRRVALSTLLALFLLTLVTGQTGVQVAPSSPHPTFVPQEEVQYLSLQAAQKAVPFQISWLGVNPGAYRYAGLVLHMGQPWAEGPVVELQYALAQDGGYSDLVVREFRPAAGATVLQVVAQGAAHPVRVGNQSAIYIDGQWVSQHQVLVWQYGTQAELLYQAHGLIFWITADQRDEVGAGMLEEWARALAPFLYLGMPTSMMPEAKLPMNVQVSSALSSASLGEVIALIPVGISPETGAAVYIAVGSPPNAGV